MRELGVHHLIAFCLNDACRHQAIIDVSSYPADNTEVRLLASGVQGSNRLFSLLRSSVDTAGNLGERQ
jgi:hypothetical protein